MVTPTVLRTIELSYFDFGEGFGRVAGRVEVPIRIVIRIPVPVEAVHIRFVEALRIDAHEAADDRVVVARAEVREAGVSVERLAGEELSVGRGRGFVVRAI